MATLAGTLTERIAVSRTDSFFIGRTATIADVLVIANALGRQALYVVPMVDQVDVRGRLTPSERFGRILRAQLAIGSRLAAGATALLREALSLRSSLKAAQATALVETLRMALQMELEVHYRVALRQAFEISDDAGHAIGALLRARIAIGDNMTRVYRAVEDISDHVGLTSVLTPQLMIVVLHRDDLELDDTQLLRAIYDGQLQDTVDFLVDVVEPSGDVTTWAMNVRTGAVTQYLNYNFNSFARSSSGTYLGASRDGLYELVGPDDAGTPVVADLITGLADLGGAFLSGVRAAYLAVRGDGQFYLRLTAGTGEEYLYGIRARSLRTTRIDMGKGLRARFFTFELISSGQDFDLVDLTFLPIVATRRV